MATYDELDTLINDEILLRRVGIAIREAAKIVAVAADTVAPFDQAPTARTARVQWIRHALGNVGSEARFFLQLMLVENKAATVTQIKNATDTTIQTSVNSFVDGAAQSLPVIA